jgi:uncharacterized protein YigA (DUF484 family)
MSASKQKSAVLKDTAAQTVGTELNDEIVREYLKNHDDFLQHNPDMLDYLHISHASGSAVSLVEKQVSVLRERNIDMRHRLKTLTANAKENDKLYEQTCALVLKLLETDSIESLYGIFMTSMTHDFGVDHASMILYGDPGSDESCRMESQESVKGEIGSLLRGQKAVCGALRKEELKFLFPEGSEAGSAALIPLSNSEQLGLIAVGSSDANHYNSKMDTLFLSHIAGVIVKLLSRLHYTTN